MRSWGFAARVGAAVALAGLSGCGLIAGEETFVTRPTADAGPPEADAPTPPKPCVVSFAAAANDVVGTGPTSVAAGDFNFDGKLDLVVANQFSSDVSVLLGNGDGTFGAAASFGAGSLSYPQSVAVADFNGDGSPDLAVADNGSGEVSVLLGRSDGSFMGAVPYGVGAGPDSVVTGDFNGDGKGDLAVACFNAPNVSVLLGNGDGTFQEAAFVVAGMSPQGVASADLNGDQKLDLVVANAISNDVSVLIGNGDGTFKPAVTYPGEDHPHGVTTGDFDGDGHLDLAVANEYAPNVSVLIGHGDGTFASAVSYDIDPAASPYAVTTGDFNGDGALDLAVADDAMHVVVLVGKGDGTFQPYVDFSVGVGPSSIASGDFNRDGKLDIVVTNEGTRATFGTSVSVLVNTHTACEP
jgi:hypothetical protein